MTHRVYSALAHPAWTQSGEEGQRTPPPCVLSIAGSDSGGGAGIQADLKTFMAHGLYGSTVITALTAQNGLGVDGIFPASPEFVNQQLETVLNGFPIVAAKTGMLFSADIIKTVARGIAEKGVALIVDPVCVSQSGHLLMEENAVNALAKHLLPLAHVITPNKPEAELLAGMDINNEEDIKTASRKIIAMGAGAVLIKGGHFDLEAQDHVTDWLTLPELDPEPLSQPKIETPNNHGTGCTLGAAITAHIALGLPLRESVIRSQIYLSTCLNYSYSPGKGHGPVNHAAPLFSELTWSS